MVQAQAMSRSVVDVAIAGRCKLVSTMIVFNSSLNIKHQIPIAYDNSEEWIRKISDSPLESH